MSRVAFSSNLTNLQPYRQISCAFTLAPSPESPSSSISFSVLYLGPDYTGLQPRPLPIIPHPAATSSKGHEDWLLVLCTNDGDVDPTICSMAIVPLEYQYIP
ncbi:hypothetical protein Cni_G19543 [Canna indica]|uniref:Uncharacterized protein n=1 Tax=Canna indica TaxID=4628 RepID=A0AAQ3QH11_9LILI|nr:hypothetical protein Cni_G19543 [Canna indica]